MRIAPTKLYAKYCCFVCVCSGTQRVSCQRTDNKPLQGDMASSHLTGQTNTGRWSRHIFQENISYLFIVIMFHENCTQLQRSPLKSSPFRPPHRNRPSHHPPPQIQHLPTQTRRTLKRLFLPATKKQPFQHHKKRRHQGNNSCTNTPTAHKIDINATCLKKDRNRR